MDWMRSYGKGRVYTTMLGHIWVCEPSPNLDCVGFQTLFAHGVEPSSFWSRGRCAGHRFEGQNVRRTLPHKICR